MEDVDGHPIVRTNAEKKGQEKDYVCKANASAETAIKHTSGRILYSTTIHFVFGNNSGIQKSPKKKNGNERNNDIRTKNANKLGKDEDGGSSEMTVVITMAVKAEEVTVAVAED
ncbi:hypothetical protein L484_024522 [Morus notabilis]|uniref:Uncharacterized protein n=1 Tax=Morus notabilis TaxID=981085 RepID=W9RQQ9_9ROSA|nr:hypothetical protein L484_024522 [Morus notabilis]